MAVAFDNRTEFAEVNNPSFDFQCTGSDRILIAALLDTSHAISSPTYDGVALTKLTEVLIPSYFYLELWYLLSPATSVKTFAFSGGGTTVAGLASYTGVPSAPEAVATNTATGGSLTCSVTTLTDNAWAVEVSANDVGTATAGASTTLRMNADPAGFTIADSNGVVSPAGSRSLILTATSANMGGIIVSLSPTAGGGGGGAFPHHYYQQMRQRHSFVKRGSIYVPGPLARAA